MGKECWVFHLGECDYSQVWLMQKRLVDERIRGTIPDTLLLLSHPPVITIGRSGTKQHILASDEVLEREKIQVFEVDRGGDITYHGPGQLVGYPVLDLGQREKDTHLLLRRYEEIFIRLLAGYGVPALRHEKHTGVWVNNKKICAIGVGVRRWVTFHGWAFNINPDLNHFGYIIPCGIHDKGVTSMTRVLGRPVGEEEVIEAVLCHYKEIFGLNLIRLDPSNLKEGL